ncbi:hypothetical protein LSTR_LSTR000982 [Laodelphax striatellus]|uniref:MADF domain-containing protein n=1 Tax=Laodelphax striatellus TaxID=195883 RepID=A0A482X2J3_LAOST|nr:hypothetical protein LSTR_LSTR000982 [Laodelphax striatellus]
MESLDLDVREFISEIKNRPAIWDVHNSDYFDRFKKKEAWEELVDIFIPDEDATDQEKKIFGQHLHRRWKSCRDGYAREVKLRKEDGAADEHGQRKRPVYIYYKQLSFLEASIGIQSSKDKKLKQKRSSTNVSHNPQAKAAATQSSKRQKLCQSLTEVSLNPHESLTEVPVNPHARAVATRSSKRQKLSQSSTDDVSHDPPYINCTTAAAPQSSQSQKLLQSSTDVSHDPFYTYGLHIANELRRYNPQTLAHVKRAFADILFRADMGQLVNSNSSQEENNSKNYQANLSSEGDDSDNIEMFQIKNVSSLEN